MQHVLHFVTFKLDDKYLPDILILNTQKQYAYPLYKQQHTTQNELISSLSSRDPLGSIYNPSAATTGVLWVKWSRHLSLAPEIIQN